KGTAIDVEACTKVRVSNNTIQNYDAGIMIFGSPPQTEAVSEVNNLILGISDAARVLSDSKAAADFDYNILSPKSENLDLQVHKKTLDLARFLQEARMPHTKIAKGVVLKNRDLSAVEGVATVDQGKALRGITFKGSAPDIGVAEK